MRLHEAAKAVLAFLTKHGKSERALGGDGLLSVEDISLIMGYTTSKTKTAISQLNDLGLVAGHKLRCKSRLPPVHWGIPKDRIEVRIAA